MRTACAIFAATMRATLPFLSWGEDCTLASRHILPYFGLFPSFFRCLNKAFSAPISCIVEAVILESFSKEPAIASIFDASIGAITKHVWGIMDFAMSFMYALSFVSSVLITSTVL